jgi:hypothetical protein
VFSAFIQLAPLTAEYDPYGGVYELVMYALASNGLRLNSASFVYTWAVSI